MTLRAHPQPCVSTGVAPPTADRDVVGTVLGVIWALGSLMVVGGLGYLVHHEVGPAADAQAAATTPDAPPSIS